MSTSATIGKGFKLQINDGTSSAYQDIDEMMSFTTGDVEASQIEIKRLDASDSYIEFIPGLINPGTIEVKGYYNATKYARLKGLLNVPKTFKAINAAATQTETFSGFIKKVNYSVNAEDEPVEINLTIQVSGAPTVA